MGKRLCLILLILLSVSWDSYARQDDPFTSFELQIPANGRYIEYKNGSSFLYLGDTAWSLLSRLTKDEVSLYLKNRKEKGFTVIQTVILPELEAWNERLAIGVPSIVDVDSIRLHPVYLEHIDWVLEEAERLGLFIGLLPTWGDKVDKQWGKGPELFDEKNARNYGRMLGARYADYAKILEDPIERTQTLSGGAAVHSFQNADTGVAAGVEVEFRRELFRDFRVGANASYMYTNVQLPEGGAYTNAQRSLQGASPYLVNADISYAPKFKNDTQLTATLLYNLQGPRIHAVGISGLGDVKQEDLHTLDFVATYKLNDHWNFKLQMTDLLNQDIVFKQEVKDGRKLEVERYGRGTTFELGFSYTL